MPEVHVGTPVDTCRENNSRLPASSSVDGGYDAEDFANLCFRYEEPNGMNRWDSPLFTVLYDNEAPPLHKIWNVLIGSDGKAKPVRPNQATVLVRSARQPVDRRV